MPLLLGWLVLAVLGAGAPAPRAAPPAASAPPSLHLEAGRLFVDGRAELGPISIHQSRFGYLHFYVPGHGLFTVGAAPFPGAERAGRFDGSTLSFDAGGTRVRLSAAGPILSIGEADAWVLHDPHLTLNVTGAVYGYGDTPSIREQWLERFGQGG